MEPAEEGTQQTETPRRSRRRRVLYSCGASVLIVAGKAYQRVEGLDSSLGSLAKKLSSWTSPVLHPLKHKWLSLLSLADGYVLTAEDAVVSVFPPADRLFDVLDQLALLSESAPEKFDDVADQLPAMLRRAPFVDWAAVELGQGWRLLSSVWEGAEGAGEEREIAVDTVEQPGRPAGSSEEEGRGRAFAGESGEAAPTEDKLEQTTAEKPDRGREEIVEEEKATADKAENNESRNAVREKDQIFDLFDEGWCMTRP